MSSKARGLADLGNAFDDGALSNRNLIINGAMQVAQRGTSSTFNAGNSLYTTVDRFKQAYFGTWASNHAEITQETDGPDGFLYSSKIKALVAQDYSNALGSWVQYSFENQNIASLQNGNGLKDLTASLWLKSNKTGNVTLSVEGEDYSYSTYVTINTADTWEYKTVTFPATSLAVGIDYTNDPTGSDFNFKVGLGSNGSWLVDVDDQWNDKTTNRGVLSPQQTNFQATINDYLQITGVQLEVGDTATPFEHCNYDQEHLLCQRYFQRFGGGVTSGRMGVGGWNNNTSADIAVFLTHEMRVSPTVTAPSKGRVLDLAVAWHDVSSFTTTETMTKFVNIGATISGSSAAAQGDVAVLGGGGAFFDYLMDAEL